MSTTAKALIITWVVIGFLVVGGVGFYVGRVTAPKPQTQGGFNQQPIGGQQQGGSFQPQPSGTMMQQPQGGTQQQPFGTQQGGQQGGSYQQPRQ